MGAVKLGASFEQTGSSTDSLFVSVAYNLDKNLKLAGTFGTVDDTFTVYDQYRVPYFVWQDYEKSER